MRIIAKKGFVFQIWRSFILFILIPVILLNIAISYILHDMESTIKNAAETRLFHAQFLLNQNITDSLSAVRKIGSDYNIQKMSSLQKPLTLMDYETLRNVQKFFRNMVTANDAYSISVLCNGSNIFVTENAFCLDLDEFYRKAYGFDQIPMEELKEYGHAGKRLIFYPYSSYNSGEVKRNGIFYKTVLTPYAGKNTGATAIIFFNEENLQNILGDSNIWNGMTYIMDAGGRVLYQIGNAELNQVVFPTEPGSEEIRRLPEKYFGKDNFAMAAGLSTGLQIVTVIPERNLLMRTGSLRSFIWILNGTTLIMCLILSLSMAQRRGRILYNALELMDHDATGSKNVFSALYNSVSSMVDANVSLKNALGEQKKLIKSVFWTRVLTINSMSDEELKHLAESAGIPWDAAGYCLLLIGFGSENEVEAEYWNLLQQKRNRVLEEISQDHTLVNYVGSSGGDQIVLLFPLEEELCGDYRNYVTEKMEELNRQNPTELFVCSTVFKDLRDIYSAYSMCSNQMNLWGSYMESRGIVWCSEEEVGKEFAFYFTDQLKDQIVLWIKSGQQEMVKESFRQILEENYLNRHISAIMEQLLISKLKLTLLGAYDRRMSVNMTEVFEHIDKIQTDAWRFSYILRVAIDMCGHYMAGIHSREENLQKKIIGYIDKHFSECGFGLYSVAEYCNFSETYFSQVFKEIIGENFSVYVEKKRMAYAYQLITESDDTIETVSEMVGYSNTNAFRKAYKRFYGVSPSQCRKK
ncbi:MAG: AraC family transcriptional regulator [Lachnospiraceae bacterium]|nr:AraC family transcriptional regulator [Lachnospiraceae bacterium]